MFDSGLIVSVQPVLDPHHNVIVGDVARHTARSLDDGKRLAVVDVGKRPEKGCLPCLVRTDNGHHLVVVTGWRAHATQPK